MSAFAPDAQLTSIIDNWDMYYVERTRAAMEGTWVSEDVWAGIDSGMVDFPEYGPMVPEDVKAAADVIKEGIVDGSFHSFQGPIKNQSGEIVAEEGTIIDDGVLLGMDFYVEGVQGALPK